jgi:hypothetical protein
VADPSGRTSIIARSASTVFRRASTSVFTGHKSPGLDEQFPQTVVVIL